MVVEVDQWLWHRQKGLKLGIRVRLIFFVVDVHGYRVGIVWCLLPQRCCKGQPPLGSCERQPLRKSTPETECLV